jgi:hypothetical protein
MTSPSSTHQDASAYIDVLTREHRYQLAVESAILPELIDEEEIHSETSSFNLPKPDLALRHPNTHKGQYFGIWGETDDNWRPKDLGPGIWFGTRDVQRRLSGQYRPDQPRIAYNGQIVKYEGCRGTRPSFAVPERCVFALINTMTEVFFTEGYKKALALASAGACAISLAGVDSWSVKPEPDGVSEPVEDFDHVRWHGRIVWIVYDSDAASKEGVQYAERRLRKELESRGAVVVVLRIPHAADGSKRGVDDYFRDRLATGVSRGDALCELKGPALAELIRLSRLRAKPVTGTDGEQPCQNCAPLAEQTRTYKAELELIRRGPVPTAEALAIDHLVSVSHNARARGETVVPLYVPADAKSAGVGDNTMTRALNQVRRWQENEGTSSALSFRIEDEWKDGKSHVKLRVLPLPDQDGAGWTKAKEYRAIATLPRDETRGKHGGARLACPKHPDAPLTRTRIWRCTEDACTWVYQDTATIGGTPDQDGAGGGDVSEIHAAVFVTTVHVPPNDDRHQDGPPNRPETTPDQDGAGHRLIPVSFVSRDDVEWGESPHYWGESPPESTPDPLGWQPPPIAPRSHLAWNPRRHRPVQAVAGGDE